MLSGQSDKAQSLGQHAVDLARMYKERGNEAYALRLLAEVASRRERPGVDVADELFRQALALANNLGMKPLVASCHGGLAHLFRRMGRSERAQEEWNAANELLLELGTPAQARRPE